MKLIFKNNSQFDRNEEYYYCRLCKHLDTNCNIINDCSVLRCMVLLDTFVDMCEEFDPIFRIYEEIL